MPLVSIVTPTYNSNKHIQETYNSIKEQTHDNWEWLVTDDASVDNTVEILNGIASLDSRVKIFHSIRNSGAAIARNISLKNANGDFVCFLDSDDIWLPRKLEKQIVFMRDDINFSFTSYELIDDHGFPLHKKIDISHRDYSFTYQDMLKKKSNSRLFNRNVTQRKAWFN